MAVDASFAVSPTVAPPLEIDGLSVDYRGGRRRASHLAVDGVTFSVAAGEALGLVGESGAGKSTIIKTILGLQRPTAGVVRIRGRDQQSLTATQRAEAVSELRVVFQDPYSSLSPFQTVGDTIAEALRTQRVPSAQARQATEHALMRVGLPADAADRFPQQFSGGQRQRIGIARALVSDPEIIVLDEPVSALDLSTQAQVLNLLAELRDLGRYSLLFVAHDLGVVRFLCQRVVVLYRGQIMEIGSAAQVTGFPLHPYTQALTAAAPVPWPSQQEERRRERAALTRHRLELVATEGCVYAHRCPLATARCSTERPQIRSVQGRSLACHNVEG